MQILDNYLNNIIFIISKMVYEMSWDNFSNNCVKKRRGELNLTLAQKKELQRKKELRRKKNLEIQRQMEKMMSI